VLTTAPPALHAPTPKASQPPVSQSSPTPKRKRRLGAKRDRLVVSEGRVLVTAVPAGSRFKGYQDVVQDLILARRVIRYRRERWLTPDRTTVIAASDLPLRGDTSPRRGAVAGG
jgi:hypothetical protein